MALSVPDRIVYLVRLSAAFLALTRGAARRGCIHGRRRAGTHGRAVVGVWELPDDRQAQRLENILAAAGWHDYFAPTEESAKPRSFFDLGAALSPIDERNLALERQRR